MLWEVFHFFNNRSIHTTFSSFSEQLGSISVAREADSLLLQYSDHVELWQLGSTSQEGGDSGTFLPITEVEASGRRLDHYYYILLSLFNSHHCPVLYLVLSPPPHIHCCSHS